MEKINLICENCGKEFVVNKDKKKQTCSKNCRWELRKKNDSRFYETKKCLICDSEFTSKIKEHKKYCSYKCSGNAKHQLAREIRVCQQCGNEFEERKKHERKFCSEKCRLTWQTNPTHIEKRIEKSKQVLLANHGVDSIFKLTSFQKKYHSENKELYRISMEKAKETLMRKRNNVLIDRFNEIGYEILEFNDDKLKIKHPDGHDFENDRKLLVNRLNHNTEISTKLLPVSASKSTLEIKITNFLNELNVKYLTNDRKLVDNYEIDVVIDKIGIELNGLYWHSEYYLDKEYHVRKLNACKQNNIELLHFFEDEIIEKFDIIKSMIRVKLNLNKNVVYARNCQIFEITQTEANKFLNKNHLQGGVNSKYRYGLFYQNEMVSLMTFGNKRKVLGSVSKDDEFELLRFCSKLNFSVVGGAGKLLKHFIKNHNPEKIITYANRRYSNGNLYRRLGFSEISITPPNYWYVVNKQRKHRFLYRKDVLLKEGYDPNKTEHQIMLKRKIPRIYDCGNLKYEINLIKNPSI